MCQFEPLHLDNVGNFDKPRLPGPIQHAKSLSLRNVWDAARALLAFGIALGPSTSRSTTMQTAEPRAIRPSGPRSVVPVLALAIWCGCLAGPVAAAPLTSATETASESPEAARLRGAAQGLDEQRITDAHTQSKTIKMLLEMQQAPAPLEGTGQSKREQAAQARAEKAAQLPDAPIQTQETPVVDWRSGLPGRTVTSNQVTENSGAPRAEGALVRNHSRPVAEETRSMFRDMLPANWISYLREKRQWVLGTGVGLLALGWLAASLFTRRR